MSKQYKGSNFFAGKFDSGDSTISVALVDATGYAYFCYRTASGAPTTTTASLYQPGCIIVNTGGVNSNVFYINTGTLAAPVWSSMSQSQQATAPTISLTSVYNAAGITAAYIAAGSTDLAGYITTVGTSTGGTYFAVSFNQAFTKVPHAVQLGPINANAAAPNTMPYVSKVTASYFVVTVPSAGLYTVYASNPSYNYIVGA